MSCVFPTESFKNNVETTDRFVGRRITRDHHCQPYFGEIRRVASHHLERVLSMEIIIVQTCLSESSLTSVTSTLECCSRMVLRVENALEMT